MYRVTNKKIKKGQNFPLSGNHGNQTYNTLESMGIFHILSQLSPNCKARIRGVSIRNIH